MAKADALGGLLKSLGLLADRALSLDETDEERFVVPPGDPTSPPGLLRLCDSGALVGGLSVALDLRPDELLGPLAHALGADALKLKVLDVRGARPVELTVALGPSPEVWEVDDLAVLVDRLNQRFSLRPAVKVIAVLGEWEEMLQLWCVPKATLRALLEAPFFAPLNRSHLAAIVSASVKGSA